MRLSNRPHHLVVGSLLASSMALAQGEDAADTEGVIFGDAAAFGEPGGAPVEAEAVDVDAPPPVNRAVIQGVLRDGNGEPAVEASVTLLGTSYRTVTDVEGRYRLEVPPGTYDVRFFYELHKPAQVQGVTVEAGQIEEVNGSLEAQEGAVQEIEVVGVLEKTRLEGQLLARQRAASVGDLIGRAEISKTPDSNAAEAARRVVGATIVGGRFVYVRGLGERYSNALFDGAPLPSPEPDRAAIPLDLFPVAVMDSITIVKTFTPDLPADFAGGSVQIDTRSIPEDLVFNTGVSLGYVTGSTFTERPMYRRSKPDWLGVGAGQRELPAGLSSRYPLTPGAIRPDGSEITYADAARFGRAMNSSMGWDTLGTPPNHGVSLVLGNGWKLGREQKVGAIGSFTYSRSFNSYGGVLREFQVNPDDPRGFVDKLDYRFEESSEKVSWGALGSVAYAPSKDHELQLVVLHSQLADTKLELQRGPNRDISKDIAALRQTFDARGLDVVRLTGVHDFEAANDGRLTWSSAYSRATRDQPDTRDAAWTYEADDDEFAFITNGDSGRRFYSEMGERGLSGTIDYLQPLGRKQPAKVKLGGFANVRDRDFSGRRFVYSERRGFFATCSSPFTADCPDQTFTDSDITTPTDLPNLLFSETTKKTDGYDAELDVFAAYLMADADLFEDLRLILGERYETTRQTIAPKDFGLGDADGARLTSQDLLPSVSLVYSATKKAKVRGAVTRTLARPQLRELAPFAFNDVYGGRERAGNPELTLTHIWNADMRFEYYPTLREVAAFSIFYKDFEDPIEETLVPVGGSDRVTYVNSPRAKLIGLELEARKDLAFIARALEDFSTVANVTLAKSRVQLDQTGFATITNLSRPMVNQAPWVLNLALDYDNEDAGTKVRASFNVNGRHIVEAGAAGMPDAYRHPTPALDLTGTQQLGKGFQLKAGIEDLTNPRTVITQGKAKRGDAERESYRDGSTVFLGVSYDY